MEVKNETCHNEADYPATYFKCSACGALFDKYSATLSYGAKWDFCPQCGSKVERAEEGA